MVEKEVLTARQDFWKSDAAEPHKGRRKAILEKYPKIKELYGYDSNTKYVVVGMVITQFVLAYYMQSAPTWLFLLTAYVVGGTINHALSLSLHEISHNLLFAKASHNVAFGYFANLPIGLPSACTFKRYHLEHHAQQGVLPTDTDIPTQFEGWFFDNAFKKTIWVFLQPCFYAIRPLLVSPKSPSSLELINWVTQMTSDALVYYFFGGRALGYFLTSTLLGLGLHPCAGHFISEHYVFSKGFETYSYYGPLNFFTFNVGFHNEHHDFPQIPGSRLHLVKAMAPEFYDNLPHHTSWVKVIFDYIMDPAIGPYSRVIRETMDGAKKIAGKTFTSKDKSQ